MQSKISAYSGLLLALCLSVTSSLANAAGYSASNGKLYEPAGNELIIRGISNFGFNSTILQPQYLWEMGWKQQIDQIKALGFNAVRLPFVPDTLYNTTPVDKLSYIDANKNPDLIGKTPLQAMDMWMAYADSVGLYVMLDFHSVSMIRQYPTWFVSAAADYNLIYNKAAYSKDDWIRDLTFVAKRYASLPHFFAIDLYNEPEGAIRWSAGDGNVTNPAYFWKNASDAAGNAVLAANPNLLIFVQGINGNFDGIEQSNIPMNWGEDFQPLSYQPSAIPASKLVLTPHTYGPDVYVKSTFSAANYPSNLAQDWETLFGKQYPTHPVVIGEWGGRYGDGPSGQKDVQWQQALVQYLLGKGIHSSFYWCYSPNSGDSGGILDDNLQVRQDKLALLKTLWGTDAGGGTGTGTVPASSTLGLAVSTASASRGSTIKLRVARSGSMGSAVSVQYRTVNGSAVAGTDYVASSGSLAWGKEDAAVKTITLTMMTTRQSAARSFSVALSSPTGGAALGTPASALVTVEPNYAAGGSTPQPVINAFSPVSGPAGTVVSLYGKNFTGANRASCANGTVSTLKVLDASNAQVTIAASCGSGPLTIANSAKSASSGGSFAVTSSNPQQSIKSFSPASGAAGTVITLAGSGFTGSTQAWIGAAHNAVIKVLSDTSAQVTVPAGATTGKVALLNPVHAAFTANAFTMNGQ